CTLFSFPVIANTTTLHINRWSLPAYTLLILVITGYIRCNLAGNFAFYKAAAISFIWIMLIAGAGRWRAYKVYPEAIWRSIQFYVAVNVFALAAHVPPPENAYEEAGGAKILSLLGLDVDRILFPFALGVNGFGVIVGLAVVISAIFVQKRPNIVNIFYFSVCIVALFLSDSRGALGSTL